MPNQQEHSKLQTNVYTINNLYCTVCTSNNQLTRLISAPLLYAKTTMDENGRVEYGFQPPMTEKIIGQSKGHTDEEEQMGGIRKCVGHTDGGVGKPKYYLAYGTYFLLLLFGLTIWFNCKLVTISASGNHE